jgi:hypothetical protein
VTCTRAHAREEGYQQMANDPIDIADGNWFGPRPTKVDGDGHRDPGSRNFRCSFGCGHSARDANDEVDGASQGIEVP